MSYTETSYGEHLHKTVSVTCKDGQVFKGDVFSFGGSVQGKEEFGVEEPYLEVDVGGSGVLIFEHEIESIEEK
jgi:hypothetical protein